MDIGNSMYRLSLQREEKKDGSIRIFTPIGESDAIIELLLRYADGSRQDVLTTGYIKRFGSDGTLLEDQSAPDMQDVRFIRQEVPEVSQLGDTRWFRISMVISGRERTYPFNGSVIEFSDTEENLGRIPDNVERVYPFTYKVTGDALALAVEAGGTVTKATVKIQSNVLIATVENSTLYFLPAEL